MAASLQTDESGWLPRHPFSAVPVAAALVLTEGKPFARSPAPVVLVHDDAGFVGIVVGIVHVPADAVLADDGCGSAETRRHDDTGADCGGGKDLLEHFCSVSWMPRARRANAVTRFQFQQNLTETRLRQSSGACANAGVPSAAP